MLTPPSDDLFFTRNDEGDPRWGDLASRGEEPGDDVRVVLLGIPCDEGVRRNRGRAGAAGGPSAFRRAFYRLTPYRLGAHSVPEAGLLHDLGDVSAEQSLEEVHDRTIEIVEKQIAAGRTVLVIGGGHDITYAGATGVSQAVGEIGLLNIDAHLDVRPAEPERNSGTSFRMLIDEGSLVPERFVEFGVQSHVNSHEHVRWLQEQGGEIESIQSVRRTGFGPSLETAIRRVSVGGAPWYATLDLDGIRAADAPGVSAPMPDGFTAGQAILAASTFGRTFSCKAFDIAELNPEYDVDGRTAKLAALAAAAFVGERLGG